jgi:hypothetical protein
MPGEQCQTRPQLLDEGSKTVLYLDPRRSICRKPARGKKKMKVGTEFRQQGPLFLPKRTTASSFDHGNDIGSGGQSRRHFGSGAGRKDQVVIVAGT